MNCPKCGQPMYDNRPKKQTGEYKINAPDFKCGNCGHAQWMTTKKQPLKTTPTPTKVISGIPSEIWERKDIWQAKMSAWKSSTSLYQGTGKEKEAAALEKTIYQDIISSYEEYKNNKEDKEVNDYISNNL